MGCGGEVWVKAFTVVVDLSISVLISLPDHIIHFFIRQFLPEVGHDVSQLGSVDETIAIMIKQFESIQQSLVRIRLSHHFRHQDQELTEFDGTIA